MKSRLHLLMLLCSLLAACGGNSSVQKLSQGTFQITEKAAASEGGVSAARRKALKKAATYCQSKGKQLDVMEITNGSASATGGSVAMTFRCV